MFVWSAVYIRTQTMISIFFVEYVLWKTNQHIILLIPFELARCKFTPTFRTWDMFVGSILNSLRRTSWRKRLEKNCAHSYVCKHWSRPMESGLFSRRQNLNLVGREDAYYPAAMECEGSAVPEKQEACQQSSAIGGQIGTRVTTESNFMGVFMGGINLIIWQTSWWFVTKIRVEIARSENHFIGLFILSIFNFIT